MPKFTGIDHIAITVTNLDRSVEFYEKLFGMPPVGHLDGPGLHRKVFRLPDGTTIGLTKHETAAPHGFSPFVPGMDHLGLGVESVAELDNWLKHLTDLGIENSGIVSADYGTAISFTDPDGTAFDLFVSADRTAAS